MSLPQVKTVECHLSSPSDIDEILKYTDPNTLLNGMTMLQICCRKNFFASAKRLIEKGANVNARSSNQSTALMTACECVDLQFWYNYDLVKLLVENGATINLQDNEGCTALWYACQSGNIDVVKYLISKGASPTIRNNEDISPIGITIFLYSKDLEGPYLPLIEYLITTYGNAVLLQEANALEKSVIKKSCNNL